MNPRNTRSNPDTVAEDSRSAITTASWLMVPRLHRGWSSVHQDERPFGALIEGDDPR
jgi:hypothetical protein